MNTTPPDPEDVGKLFVGGLSSTTTKESLHDYFTQFGEVVDSVVMKNNETGRSRGFGFVTFKDPNCVFKVLQARNHELDGKRIDPKECTPRSLQKMRRQLGSGKCKLFLGGLPPDVTENDIRHGMSKFGKVDQVVIMMDQETKKCRGFGFLSFELEESIEQACAEHFVIINDKQIECKKAEPRIYQRTAIQQQGFSKSQNGTQRQNVYGQMSNANQNSWISPSQSVYNMPGNFGNYLNFGNSAMPLPSSPMPGFTNMQLPYAQSYPQNYATSMGNYMGFSPVPANSYQQAPLFPSTETTEVPTSTVSPIESGNSYGSNNYQTTSSYGPAKVAFGGVNAPDVAYNQSAMPSFQRYHPYKV